VVRAVSNLEAKQEEAGREPKAGGTLVVGILGEVDSERRVFLRLLDEELRRRGVRALVLEAGPADLRELADPGEKLVQVVKALRGAREGGGVDVVLVDIGWARPDLGQMVTREVSALLRFVDGVVIVSRNLPDWLADLETYAPDMKVFGALRTNPRGAASMAKAGLGVIAGLSMEAYREGRVPEDARAVVAEVAARILAGEYHVAEKLIGRRVKEIAKRMEMEIARGERRQPEPVPA